MLSSKLEKALNDQVNAEFWSSYLYYSMSVHFAQEGLSGFAKWFKVQADEEKEHAEKIVDFIIARGGKVDLKPIEKVTQSWNSPLAAFEDTLKHEKEVTAMIHNLVDISRAENDYATESMLMWFVNEQIEEESTAQGYVDALKCIGSEKLGIYMLNKELGGRN